MSVEKKVLIVIAPVQFRDEELSEPIKYLEKAGIGYDIISTQTGLAIGMLGGKVLIKKTVRDVSEAGITPYAGILIVGGGGSPDHLWNNKPLQTLVQEFDAAGKILSAICLSTVVLAQAGVLKGKQATVWNDDAAIHQLRQGGATYKPDPIVSDGRVITANGPPAAAGFGEKVAKAVLAA